MNIEVLETVLVIDPKLIKLNDTDGPCFLYNDEEEVYVQKVMTALQHGDVCHDEDGMCYIYNEPGTSPENWRF